jgi:hypothetical protein
VASLKYLRKTSSKWDAIWKFQREVWRFEPKSFSMVTDYIGEGLRNIGVVIPCLGLEFLEKWITGHDWEWQMSPDPDGDGMCYYIKTNVALLTNVCVETLIPNSSDESYPLPTNRWHGHRFNIDSVLNT